MSDMTPDYLHLINFDPFCILATIKSTGNTHASASISTGEKFKSIKDARNFLKKVHPDMNKWCSDTEVSNFMVSTPYNLAKSASIS